jgi:hypothetical protein
VTRIKAGMCTYFNADFGRNLVHSRIYSLQTVSLVINMQRADICHIVMWRIGAQAHDVGVSQSEINDSSVTGVAQGTLTYTRKADDTMAVRWEFVSFAGTLVDKHDGYSLIGIRVGSSRSGMTEDYHFEAILSCSASVSQKCSQKLSQRAFNGS